MKLRIYNRTGADGTFLGQAITSDAYYDVPEVSRSLWADDPEIRSLVMSGQLGVGDTAIEHKIPADGFRYLERFLPQGPIDSDGSSMVRTKTTRTGWHFEPRALDFWTARVGSLHNKKADGWSPGAGTDIGDAVMKFYDQNGTLLTLGEGESEEDFQTRVTANCTVTIVDWEAAYTFDMKGAYFQILDPPSKEAPAYLWLIAAPDIPAVLGGQVHFANGGWNLAFFADRSTFEADGGGVKGVTYDPVYHSSKLRLFVQHAAGEQIGIQLIYKQYKA